MSLAELALTLHSCPIPAIAILENPGAFFCSCVCIVQKSCAVKIVNTKTKESWQFGEATVNAVALYGEQGKRVGPLWFKILYSIFQHVKQDVWGCGDHHVKIAVVLK